MTMNSPKIFIAAFCFVSLILIALLSVTPDTQSSQIQGVVLNQTLTQSLDGHRRFINILTSDDEELLIQADPKIDCPKGSKVTIIKESGLVASIESFQLVKCLSTQ